MISVDCWITNTIALNICVLLYFANCGISFNVNHRHRVHGDTDINTGTQISVIAQFKVHPQLLKKEI